LLWLVAVGLVALTLWQASEAIWGYLLDVPPCAMAWRKLLQIGYLAKGVAVHVVGRLLTHATLTFDRQKQGLDGAMQAILAQPFGRSLLTAAARSWPARWRAWPSAARPARCATVSRCRSWRSTRSRARSPSRPTPGR
jgi:hypothetical protein